MLDALGVEAVEVRVPEHLSGVDALFLPGGESTTITKLLDTSGLREPLAARLAEGLPAFGTCAGLILLARRVDDEHGDRHPGALGALDCRGAAQRLRTPARVVRGRARGRRVSTAHFPGVFIRAPVVGRASATRRGARRARRPPGAGPPGARSGRRRSIPSCRATCASTNDSSAEVTT